MKTVDYLPEIRETAKARALLDACLETSGSMKGNEVRDVLLGRIFGLGAIVRSGLVTKAAETAEVVQELATTANKKSFLREVRPLPSSLSK